MTNTDTLSDALRAFGEACGLPDLVLDEDGVAGIEVGDDQVTFFLSETPIEHLLITTLIAQLDPADTQSPRALMRTNFASWFSGAMTVGLDENGAVVGAATLPAMAASGEALTELVRGLLSAAERTRQALLNVAAADSGTDMSVRTNRAATPMA